MDSKQKFIKNRLWKRRKNGTTANVNRLTRNIPSYLDLDCDLKQPVPKEGWFPVSDSETSDLEDFSSLAKISGNKKQSDKNWFDKELDNIQVAAENNKQSELKPQSDNKNYKVKEALKDQCVDAEEKELDFLLSLKEPDNSGPVYLKKNIPNDKKLVSSNNNKIEQKPIKSIDLEKWLDSVLDE